MKKKLNIFTGVFMVLIVILIIDNMVDAINACFEMGRGTSQIDISMPAWIAKLSLWALDINSIIIAGIFIIMAVRNINKSIVFSWKNVRLFRWAGIVLLIHSFLSSGINHIDYRVFHSFGERWVNDVYAFVAAVFVLLVAEIFAVGLRLQEEQDLTI